MGLDIRSQEDAEAPEKLPEILRIGLQPVETSLHSVVGNGRLAGVTRSKREFCTLTTHRAIKMPTFPPGNAEKRPRTGASPPV